MTDFESKLKKIVEIDRTWDDTWEFQNYSGYTKFYSFLNNTYCVSMCEHKNSNLKSYVFSKGGNMLYVGHNEKGLFKCIKKVVKKAKKELKENENQDKTN